VKSKSLLGRGLAIAVAILTVILPCRAVELLISDSGRNTSWMRQLKVGDSFDVAGGDNKPVGGIFNLSSSIGQFLLPMPEDLELSRMTRAQEDNLVREWGELILDRVHLAVENREAGFEIRLLQNTPRPRTAGDAWSENPNADVFARIAYASIAKTVDYLKEREEPVKITTALADSGSGIFARAIDSWRPYASAFRRVDFVHGRASLKESRQVVAVLGAGRVRLFINTAGSPTPAMTVGRREIAEALQAESRGLMVLCVRPENSNPPESSQPGLGADWMDVLTGSTPLIVEKVTGKPSGAGSLGLPGRKTALGTETKSETLR